MTEEPKSTRDELIKLIETGDLDKGSQVIVAVLLKEVLPALDHINAQIKGRLVFADMALAEIHAIYGHLQDLAEGRKAGPLGRARIVLQERLEKAISHLEKAGGKQ
jgi:hypothetical protein